MKDDIEWFMIKKGRRTQGWYNEKKDETQWSAQRINRWTDDMMAGRGEMTFIYYLKTFAIEDDLFRNLKAVRVAVLDFDNLFRWI